MADNINQQLQQNGALPTPDSLVPSSGRFEFQPISDFVVSPDLPEYSELMTPEYKAMLDNHAKQINSAIPTPVGNMNDPNPTLSTSTYNPFKQRSGLNLSTPEGKLQLLSNTGKFTKPTGEVKIADPLYAGIRSHNFDRYYKHSEFSSLGWHPYADNEAYYNANSTWWDDASRMWDQFGNLASTGFLSAYRSIGDLFDSDDYFTGKDMESAREFADAMRIGNSTRGGALGFTNNLLLQFGYTTGVIGSIAAEELALWGAAGVQGFLNPVSDTAAISRTGFNIARLGRTVANTFDLSRLANATRNMYRGLRSVDGAKDVYTAVQAGGNFLGNIIAPETLQAIRTLNSTANGAQNLSNMAKVSKTFGGFYRDLRSLNLALAESKMEGGMVYSQQLANGYALQSQLNNGSPITPEQMQNIEDKASRAAYYTTLLNAPIIYLSNQLVLGNAFGAYNRTLSRMLGDNIQGIGGRILKTKGLRDAAGKAITRPFEYVGDGVKGYLKTLKAAGVRGSAKLAGQASLRYFSANLAEGIQEVAQEAIAEGTKHYHQTLIEYPTAGGYDLRAASIASAVGSQFSAQGFETFMSGFLMGGIVQGPQKLFFQGVPSIYKYGLNPVGINIGTEKQKADFAEYKKNKEEFINGLTTALNDTYEVTANNPMESIFDTNKINHIIQSQASIDMLQAAFDQSNFDFVDAKDFSKFQAIYTVLANNKGGEFRQQFEDYLKLTDDELAEAFPSFKADIKSGKLRTRLQDMISKVDELEESYAVNKSKFHNPFDPSIYKYGSREWNEEKIKQMSFEHARYLYMFTEDGFKRAVERSQKIYDELAADPIVGKMAASDITVLLDENSLQKEIATLLAEIGTLDPKDNKDIIEAKTAKLEGLNGILSVLYAEENMTKDGGFDRRKIGKLTAAFEKYVQKLAKSNGTFADIDKVETALKKIVDYRDLKARAIAYNKSIEYMNNPERFDEIRQRTYEFFKNIYKNRVEVFRNSIKKYVGKIEINQFLNELAKIEVYPDPKQVKEFMETGNIDVLEDFFTEKGAVNAISDKDIYDQIQALIGIYKAAVTPEVTAQTEEEKIESKEKKSRKKETADILDEADIAEDTPGVEIFGTNESANPVIKKVLEEKYKEYVSRQANLGKVPVAMDSWLNSAEAAKYVTAYEALKKLWYKDLQSIEKDAKTLKIKFDEDTGFEQWLTRQQTNDIVRKVLKTTETNFSDFIDVVPDFETGDIEEAEIGDAQPVGKVVDNSFNSVQIIETKTSSVDPDTGEIVPVTLYSVRDKKGKILSEDKTSAAGVSTGATFSDINKARSAAKKIDDVTSDTTSFTFGGMNVSYGSIVTDSEGKRYMVIGTPAEVAKGKKLFLLPVDDIKEGQSKQDRHKLAKKVTETEFKEGYKPETFNFTRVPKDASRLRVNEAVEIYPFENGIGTAAAEGFMMANARLQTILENLTPEERSSLVLVIKRNAAGGQTTGKKYQTRDEDGNWKEANPYINRVTEPFSIGIKFGSEATATRVNQILADKGMAASADADGVFAFIRSGSIQILNKNNQPVNPINLTKELIEDTFTIQDREQATALQTITNNFAIQQAFINEVADKMKDSESATIPMSEFKEFGFNLSSWPNIKTNPKSVKDLKYNTVDGVRVIMINDKLKDGTVSTRILADIEDIDEREAFIEKIKQEMATSQPGLFERLQKEQRYVALIKTPNGIYTGAYLKSAQLTEDQVFELSRELVAEAVKTINENLEGEGSIETRDIKDVNYNIEFNKEFNRKFYITTNIDGFTIEINVNSDGSFRAELYDKKGKKVVGKSYVPGRQNTLEYAKEEKPDVISRLLDNLQEAITEGKALLEKQKKKDPKVEIPEWTKLKLSIKNVRASFAEDASVDTVIDNTVTTLEENVRGNYKLKLTADSTAIEEAKVFAATTATNVYDEFINTGNVPEEVLRDIASKVKNRQPLTPEEQAIFADKTARINEILAVDFAESSEEAYDSVLDMSDEVFEEFAKKDFRELPVEMKQQIANKIARGESLSAREERIVKNAVSGQTIQLLVGKIERDNNVDSDKKAFQTELAKNRARIKEIEAEIDNAEPDMIKAGELIEDNEERAQLIKRNREIEQKLIANKIISENLTDTEVSDIDEFIQWASDNLPDFISIEDISNLRDNLVTNGIRVGAFALSMNAIAGGMKIKGTLYTGAKSPFKYHEAFHAVFRSLLSNAQQDKLLNIAKIEVKKKLGNKFEEELEKFRNSANTYKAMSRQELEREFYEEYMADEFEKFKKDPKSTKTDSAIKNFFNKIIEILKALFGVYTPYQLQDFFREIDSAKFKSASPINNRFTDSLANGITVANKIIPIETVQSETGQFGYRTLDNSFARSIVSSISARVIMLEQENENAKFNLKQAVNQSFVLFKNLYSTKREAYKYLGLSADQKSNLRDLEKAFTEYGDFIKDAVYDELKFYDIKSRKVEEDLEEMDDMVGDRLRTTDQYDKDITSIGGFSSLSSFLRKYIGSTPLSEVDQFGNDYLIAPERDADGNIIPGTGEKLMVTVDFATAYNGFLKAVKNLNDPIQILQQLYFFGINNPQTQAVVNRLFNDLGITWEDQLENGELPQYTAEVIAKFKVGEEVTREELNQGVKRPLLLQAVLKGFENARIDYLFIHTSSGDQITTYTAANRDDAHTQVDRWGQAYIQLAKRLVSDEGAKKIVTGVLDKLLNRLQFVAEDSKSTSEKGIGTMTDTKLIEFAQNVSRTLQEYLGIIISPKFIEFSVAKNISKPTRYQKALLNANSNEKALNYQDIREIKKIIDANQNLFSDTNDGARNRLRRIALGNAAFDENIGASVFKNPNGDLVYAHQLPSFHLKQVQALNDVAGDGAKLEELKQSDEYLLNNFLLNSEAFKQMSAEGRLRILRIAGSKLGQIEVDDNGLISETSGKTPNSGKTYGDSTPREFILNLINAYTYAIDPLTGQVASVSWTDKNGNIDTAAIAPVLLRVLEASNTGDMMALPVVQAVEEGTGGQTVLTDVALNAFVNNIAAEFTRIQRESNPDTATQELHVGYNAIAIPNEKTGTEEIIPVNVESDNVDKARAFKFHKTGVLLSPLGQKKENRQGVVIIQTSETKLERIESGEQTSLIYDRKAAEEYIGFTSVGVVRDAVIKVKEGERVVPKKIVGRGLVKVTEQNKQNIFESLKASMSLVKDEQYKYKVSIGSKNFYVESINEQQFLQGRKAMYMYDIMEADEYDTMEEIAAMVGGFDVEDYLEKLTQAARSPEFAGLTFAETLKKLNIKEDELKRFLAYRLNQEFAAFNTTLDELVGQQGGLGSFIQNGVQTANGAVTAATRQSGRLLNLKENNAGYNLRQIFFNDYINTTAINQILLGDSAYSLKDAVDEIKRAKAQAAAYYSAASTIAAPEYRIFKPLQEFSIFETTEPKVNKTHNKEKGKTDNADAQLWMTTKAFRNFQYGFGKLTPAQAILFDKIERDEEITADDIFGTEEESGYAKRQEMLNSQKLVYADGKTFVKMSAFPLIPSYTSIKDENGEYTIPKPNMVALHNLRVKLEAFEKENDTVAVAAPRSAIKMMQKNVSNIHTVTGTTTPLTNEQSVTLNANFLGLQVINPSNKVVITDPTQIKSLVTSEQDDNVDVTINGKKLKLGKVRSAYHKATRDRGNLNFINKRNLVFTFDVEYAMDELQKSIKANAITADLYTYLRYAEASMSSTGSSSHLMELFSVDSAGNPKYNLNNPLTYDKFLNLFMSYFSKSVFNEKIPGATISLVSDYGVRIYRRVLSVDENGMPDKHEVITEAQYEAMATKPDILFNIDEGSYPGNDENLAGLGAAVKKAKGKGVVIVDRLRHDLKVYDDKGKYTGQKYGEMRLPPHHKEVMEELQMKGKSIPDVVGKMFAVRIPSQDNHSTYNIKWVDFMPAVYGSSGVFARELIEISGADFDIDKLYAQFKEFFFKDGEFKEYGKAKTEKEQFNDYVEYVNKKVQDTDSVYGEALYKYNGRGTTNPLNAEQEIAARAEEFSKDAINALSVLGMPRFYAEYSTYRKKFGHEPYAAPINNDILDYKYALMGNDHVTQRVPLFLDKNGNGTTVNTGKPALDANGVQITGVPISYEAADMDVLKDLWDELKKELPEWAALVEEEGIDVDNLFGKLRMFANNKEGSRSIGAVVLPNLYLNLLQEYDVKVESFKLLGEETLPQIKFGGVVFNQFKNTYEILEDGGQGERTQYIISALITAATDNAKERLLAKLGLNINALAVVANLTALGVPIKTSILLINHPAIRQAYFQESNSPQDDPVRATKLIEDRIENLKKAFLEQEEQGKRTRVDESILSEAIQTTLIKPTATETDMAEIRESGEVSKDQVIQEISILEQFLNAAKLTNTTRYMGDLLSLSAGLGQGLEAIDKRNAAIEKLGLNLSDKEYSALKADEKPMIDVRPIFRGNTWQAGYLQRFEEFTKFLLPKVVLSANPLFRRTTDEIAFQTTINRLSPELKTKAKEKIAKDFLSFLTIKAYMHNGMVNNSQSIGTLTNGLIYNQEGVENITTIVKRLRKTQQGSNNYFLNSFLILEESNLTGNKTGLNIAGANTFLRYNDSQKLDIQNGFMQLYADPLTRYDAMALVHYMMVKDGLQYGYKSIVEAVAPIALDKYLSHIDTVQEAMERPTDTVFESTFGSSLDNLIVDFVQGYLTSAPNAYILKKVLAPIYTPVSRGIKIEPKVFTRAIAAENREAIYVFGDNSSKQGTIGNSSVRSADNSFGLVLKKNLNADESGYYSDSELGEFIEMFDKQIDHILNMIADGKEVIFPKELIAAPDLARFKKFSKAAYEYINAKLKQDFNYKVDPKEKQTKAEKAESAVSNPAILRQAVHVDASGLVPRLVVDLYRGISRVDRTNEKSTFRNIPSSYNLSDKVDKVYKNNLRELRKAGFRNFARVKKGSDLYTEVEFPLVVRQNVGSDYKAEYKYYMLVSTQSLFPQNTVLNLNGKAVGSYAEYVEVDITGSMSQNAIGFMFGNRPTLKQVRKLITEANTLDPFEDALNQANMDIDSALDSADMAAGVKIASGANVVATEKGIQVDGKNISEVTEEDAATEPIDLVEPESEDNIPDDNYDESNTIDISANSFFTDLLADNEAPENKYPELTTWWDTNIDDPFSQEALNNRTKLKEHRDNPSMKFKVSDLDGFIELYEQSEFTNEQEFLDHFNNCYL